MIRRVEVIERLRAHEHELHRHAARSLSLFGSVARDEATAESEIDLPVEFEQPVGIFEFLELQEYLQCLLGAKVDLVTVRA